MITNRSIGLTALTLGLLLGTAGASRAQAQRDPTVAPPENSSPASSLSGTEGMTVMVRDGKPFLVVGTRWYAVGDKVGAMRVDRITETEVWLHDGTALLKIPRFAGIARTVAKTKTVCAAVASSLAGSAPNPPPEVAPCEDTPQ